SAVRHAFSRIASFAGEDGRAAPSSSAFPAIPSPPSPAAPDSLRQVVVLAAEQREEALRNRDHLISANVRVTASLRAANSALDRELRSAGTRLAGAQHHIAGLENHVRGLQNEVDSLRAVFERTVDRRLRRLARRSLSTARSIVDRWKAADR